MTDPRDTMLIDRNGKLIPIDCGCGCNGINRWEIPNGCSDLTVTSDESERQYEPPYTPLYEVNSDGYWEWVPQEEQDEVD